MILSGGRLLSDFAETEQIPRPNAQSPINERKVEIMQMELDRIWKHLEWIAAVPRFAESSRLEQCRQYCETELIASGWSVNRQDFTALDGMLQTLNGINLVVHRRHQSPPSNKPVFVLGAHLDSRENTPGADDNASAVAVLLETARVIGHRLSDDEWRSAGVELELVVFDLEEHGMLGGAFHAAGCRCQKRVLCGMVSLEMLGYCSHEPGSQSLPPGLEGLYPDVGDFIAVVGNQNSTSLIQHFSAAFKSVADLPCQSLQVPNNGLPLSPTRLSDHSPFWDEGFAALMVTDTSFMRNPHYHEPSDTPETLDREFLYKVAQGVLIATEQLVRAGLNAI